MSPSGVRQYSPCAVQKGLESLGLGNKIPPCIPQDAGPRGEAGDNGTTVQRVQSKELLFSLQSRSGELLDHRIIQIGQDPLRSPGPGLSVTPSIDHSSPGPRKPTEHLGVWRAALMRNCARANERTLLRGSPWQGWSPARPRDPGTEAFQRKALEPKKLWLCRN